MLSKLAVLKLIIILMVIQGCGVPSHLPIKERPFNEKLIEIANRVPEFGGMFYDKGYLYVYLVDPDKKAAVEAAIREILGPSAIPFDKIQIIQGQYSLLQLWEWHRTVKEIPTIGRAIVDEAQNRLVAWLENREGLDMVRRELDQLDIPRDAVLLVVVARSADLGIQLETGEALVSETGIRYIVIKLKVQNLTNNYLELLLGGDPPYDFIVTNSEGTEIWRWPHKGARLSILSQKILKPGEELEFTAEWNQRDNEGWPVPPASYWVRGILYLGSQDKLETKPQLLIISWLSEFQSTFVDIRLPTAQKLRAIEAIEMTLDRLNIPREAVIIECEQPPVFK
ncbi:MAG: BsuPI-related putative proteinase inhibitor [Candidatus Caldarchaeum sp.]